MNTTLFYTLSSLLCLVAFLFIATFISKSEASTTLQGIENAQIAQNRVAGEAKTAAPERMERARRLVIFFHGIRSRGSVMGAIGDSWASVLPDTEFASPDAVRKQFQRTRVVRSR